MVMQLDCPQVDTPLYANPRIKNELDSDLGDDLIKKEGPNDDTNGVALTHFDEATHMFDDVDDLEYVDEDYEGLAEVDGVEHFICGDFKIRQVSKPVIITRPLCQLFDCIVSKHIVLDPEYQREAVWDEQRAASLISSIMMGYYIPPIIFNVVEKEGSSSDGTKNMQHKRICVDGKQRLTSIWMFMTGQIGFLDSNKPQKKWYFCQPTMPDSAADPNRNILPATVQEFFKNQAFCCYEYEDLTTATEETMFQLVQKGVTMSAAEKWRGLSTPWAIYTKDVEHRYSTVLSLTKHAQASGFRVLLTIFATILEVTGRKTKNFHTGNSKAGPAFQANVKILTKLIEDVTPIQEEVTQHIEEIFHKFVQLIELSSTQLTNSSWRIDRDSAFDPAPLWLRDEDKLKSQARAFSPLEIIACAVLITLHMEKHTNDELLEDIMWMRHALRVKHQALNLTTLCWKTIWDFVTVELNERRSDKASVPPFIRNARAWAKQRQQEDADILARQMALQKAREQRTWHRKRRARAQRAADRIREYQESKTRTRSSSAEPPVVSRKERPTPEVSFPNLGSITKKNNTMPIPQVSEEDSDSSLSEVMLDSDDEYADTPDRPDMEIGGFNNEEEEHISDIENDRSSLDSFTHHPHVELATPQDIPSTKVPNPASKRSPSPQLEEMETKRPKRRSAVTKT